MFYNHISEQGKLYAYLGAVEPLDVPQTPADLLLLLLFLGHLLLLACAELHVVFRAFCVAHDWSTGGTRDGTGDGRADGRGDVAGARTRVFETVHGDSEVALVRYTTICDVPLLRAERANELFVMRDHDDTALVVADSDGKTTQGIAIQEVSRFVEDEQVGVVPHGTGCMLISYDMS